MGGGEGHHLSVIVSHVQGTHTSIRGGGGGDSMGLSRHLPGKWNIHIPDKAEGQRGKRERKRQRARQMERQRQRQRETKRDNEALAYMPISWD